LSSRKKKRRPSGHYDVNEFRFLVSNIIPASEEGWDWILEETRKYCGCIPPYKRRWMSG
jgi:hypothetical protein